jgi:3-deoxy-D-manno-octulosonic-acid transferase
VARGESKLARSVRGRRAADERLVIWGRRARDRSRPLVWFHAPSVGEGLQARAVLEALQELRPDAQSAFTHFSPSAEGLAGRMPVDVAGYLPWDTTDEMSVALDVLSPDLVVFTKTEVWPVLSRLCAEHEIPTALVAATLAPTSSRRHVWARRLLEPSYARLGLVLAVGDEDAERLVALGVRPEALDVSGDPAVDSAAARALQADRKAPYLAPFTRAGGPVVVAGSTWPADEEVLVPAMAQVRDRVPGLRLVIAPHEPDHRHVPPLLSALDADGWAPATLSDVEASQSLGEARAVVVDRVGVLAHLYTIGSVAFVGGGFGRAGLHSVLEPAAAGLPVVFGPRHANARDAAGLITAGGAREVEDVSTLAAALGTWLASDEARASAAAFALGYIAGHRGAARRSAEALEPLLPPSPHPPSRS